METALTAFEFVMWSLPLALVLAAGAISFLTLRYRGRPARAQLAECDYVIFEAEPVNLPNIQADLAANGWNFASGQATETAAFQYRFEKGRAGVRCLSEILWDFDKFMPRTCSRTTGRDSLIKIKDHGSSRRSSV